MQAIFGVTWDRLDVTALERFLETAEDESLLWEAKGGGEPPSAQSIQKHVCGFANSLGGYLILGADRREPGWELTGVDFGQREPATWIGNCIGALRSAPAFDVKLLRVDDRQAAVIRVETAPVPPAMTANGTVYERVVGATVPVTEPLVLLDLTNRGRELRDVARETARSHALDLLRSPPERRPLREYPQHPPALTLALRAVGPPPDIAERPFRQSFFSTLRDRGSERLRDAGPFTPLVNAAVSQTASWLTVDGFHSSWIAFAHRDGTIVLGRGNDRDEDHLPSLTRDNGPLEVAWTLAADLLGELGCEGAAHLCVAVDGSRPGFRGVDGEVIVEREATVEAPDRAAFMSVCRELHRATGEVELEPESSD